jgi:8-oxo-dGTP pyrophosphatase MutT (NUDIX family)
LIHGAGILFLTSEKRALFLRRGNGGDYPGHWCFPGGTQEDGESLEECAEREAIEELGFLPGGDRTLLTRTVLTIDDSASEAASTVDYTTYAQRVSTEFAPRLNGEHTAYTWASTEEPPQLMHPGCLLALQRLTMDELDVAEAMADGRLASPQHVDNMALFCMRISGTGTSYRQAHKEFVWRDPSVWLTPRMMKRASGLSLIMEHPEKSMMDSKEFNDRIVGMVFLPYVKDDELWAVVKVYDAPTIRMLEEGQLSTSPAVVFKPDANIKVNSDDEDGEALLIEGEPSLLDHLAICGRGVWDKGGPPVGI